MKKFAVLSLIGLWLILMGWLSMVRANVPLKVEGKTETVVTELPFLVHGPDNADLYFWSVPLGVEYVDKGCCILVSKCPEGRHVFRLKVISIDWDNKKLNQDRGEITLVMGKVPDPEPDPKPDPDPKPEPAIIDADGMHVLIVFESKEKAKLSTGHFNLIYGKQFRDYLASVCAPDSNAGDGKAYRIWDVDEDTKGAQKKWQQAQARPEESLPWILISNKGVGSYEGPLPERFEEAKQLIEGLRK